MDLSNDDVLRILKIIDESGYNDIRLELGDLKLHVQKEGAAGVPPAAAPAPFSPAAAATPAAPPATPAAAPGASSAASVPAAPAMPALEPARNEPLAPGDVAVAAPILGIFYRASSPGEKPFVEVGQRVKADDTIGLIEVMKLFNSVRAGVAGTVTRIAVENGKMVEHGQTLIHIKPDA
jgi:acetyl-CoA carboxylase biotin carboxyl carrier protein